jgi:multiple sugar transport system substrate-binding protein
MYHVEAFNRGEGARRGIAIEYTIFGADYYPVLDLAISAGEEPHIFKCNQIPRRVQEGRLTPLTDLPEWYHRQVLDRYKDFIIEGIHMFDGVPYSIPWGGTSYATIAYNVPLLNSIGLTEPPATWEEFERACIAITRANPGKFGMYKALRYTNFPTIVLEPILVRSYGGTWFDFINGRYNFSRFYEYFEMIQRLSAAGAIFPGMESLDDDTARAQFSEGNIGFVFSNPSFNVGVFYDQFPARMEWRVAPIPVKDPNNHFRPQSAAGDINIVVGTRGRTENVMEQVARVHYLWMSDDMLSSLFTAGKDLPRLPSIIANAAPSDRSQWNDIARLNAESRSRPSMPDLFFPVEGDDVRTAFSRIIVGGNAQQILGDMDRRFNDAFDRAIARGVVTREYFIRPHFEQSLRW